MSFRDRDPGPCSNYAGNACSGFGAPTICMICGWPRAEHRRPVMFKPPDDLFPGVVGPFPAMPIIQSSGLERGRYMIVNDPTRGKCLIEGIGLARGIPYRTPDVDRGYVLHAGTRRATLIDAVTGRLVEVAVDDCVEVEERHRARARSLWERLVITEGRTNGRSESQSVPPLTFPFVKEG